MSIEQTDHNECPTPTGILMVIGGAEKKEVDNGTDSNGHIIPVRNEVLDCLIKLLPKENAAVEVVTTASSDDPRDSFEKYRDAFTKLGISDVGHIHHDSREELTFEELKPRLERANAIFFAGGDQLKLTSIYGGTQMMVLLKKRYIHDSLVIAGTSAGAMALSTPMIYAGVGRNEMIAGNVKVTTGLEFLKDVCIDTHFVNRGRFVRMAQVIATNPSSIGIGIEEDTALVVRNGTDAEVVGCGVVIIINGYNSSGTNITKFDDETPVTIRGLEVHILSREEKYCIPQLNPPHK